MRQMRWLELLKNYDINILYHPGKASVVVDALSPKSVGVLAHLRVEERTLAREVQKVSNNEVIRLDETKEGNLTMFHKV